MSAVPMEVVLRGESRCFTSDNTAGGAPEIIAAVVAAASGDDIIADIDQVLDKAMASRAD